jgi:hypothetical protein
MSEEPRGKTARDHIRAAFQESISVRDTKVRTGTLEQQRREYLYELLERRMNQFAADTATVIWFQQLVNICLAMPWPYFHESGGPEWMETLATWLDALPGAVLKTIHPTDDPT